MHAQEAKVISEKSFNQLIELALARVKKTAELGGYECWFHGARDKESMEKLGFYLTKELGYKCYNSNQNFELHINWNINE